MSKTIIASVITIALSTTAFAGPKCVVTKTMFDNIHVGDTQQEVFASLPCKGEETSSILAFDSVMQSFKWTGNGGFLSDMTVGFTDYVVTSKTQFHLK